MRWCWILLLCPASLSAQDFDRVIAPLLRQRCLGCHSGAEPKGGLNLARQQAVLGGEMPMIVPGKPGASVLWQRVVADEMPPKMPLKADEKQVLEQWIRNGAAWGTDPINPRPSAADWWAFQPLHKPAVPKDRHPVDYFVDHELAARQLRPVGLADRRTLIRRLYFDLIGLPPTPEQVQAFLMDIRPDAEARLVQELLASPRYGERWARHWLDVVHYGETHGYDKDQPRPHAWPYRDYVIRSFNTDKPYARFVQEQIAGDRLFPGTVDGLEALGFLAAGPWDLIGHAEVPESKIDGQVARHHDRDDFVANTMSTFLSLTVHCAQCHDHKFDPITQREYYQLQAVFAAIDRADKVYDRDPLVAEQRHSLQNRQQSLQAELKSHAEASPQRAAVQQQLDEVNQQLQRLPAPSRVYIGTVHKGSGNFVGTGATGGKPRPIHVLHRGNVQQKGELVEPGALAAIPAPFELPTNASEADRRAALAKWLTHPANPLLWRSIANRVWQYHFGRGLVDTPNDFGRMGELPTHPKLLDYLATELRDNGMSLKKLHQLIVSSETYRRASTFDATNAQIDSDNRYYWRFNRRKLEAEAVRDSVLFVAGKLNLQMGGPSYRDFVIQRPEHSPHYQYHLHDPEDPSCHRRTIYRFIVRSKPQPFLATLDCADPSFSVDKRTQSISPQQALAMLNNRLMVAMAQHMARRVESLATDRASQIQQAFQLALSRPATPDELRILTAHATDHGLASACRILFNLNEFLFVD